MHLELLLTIIMNTHHCRCSRQKQEIKKRKMKKSCLLHCIPLPAKGLWAPGPTNLQAPQKESHDVDSSDTNDSM